MVYKACIWCIRPVDVAHAITCLGDQTPRCIRPVDVAHVITCLGDQTPRCIRPVAHVITCLGDQTHATDHPDLCGRIPLS